MYIGKTNNPKERKSRHFASVRSKSKKKFQTIHNAIRKYGIDNFDFLILEECENDVEAYKREIYWIEIFNATKLGYNETKGGIGGVITSQEVKDKISAKLKGRKQASEVVVRRSHSVKLSNMTLNSLLRDLYKIFKFIPNYNLIYSDKSIQDSKEKLLFFNNYFKNKILSYDVNDTNKKLTDDLKKDVLFLFTKLESKDIAVFLNLKLNQVVYIISRYKKTGILTKEQKFKNRSESHIGIKHSEEHKRKISESNKGKIHTEESKQKISISNSGQNNGMYGKTASIEARKKQSKFQSSRSRNPLTDEHKQKIKEASKQQDRNFRINPEIKKQVVEDYATNKYTKKQLSEKFNIKFNTIVKIIRTAKNQ